MFNRFKIFFLIVAYISFLNAKDVIQTRNGCIINWTKGFLECSATSEENQSRFAATIAAKTIAQRDMLEFVKGVRIDSTTTIKDGMLKSDIIKTSINGVIRGAQIIKSTYNEKLKSATVTVRISLYKDILKSILNPKIAFNLYKENKNLIEKFLSFFYLYASEYNYRDEETLKKLLDDFKNSKNKEAIDYIRKIIQKIKKEQYTGLIIDASNVSEFNLALIPKIRKFDGDEIYPKNFLQKETIISQIGPVTYEIGLNDAKKNRRVYDNPILLNAIKIYGKRTSDLVLDKKSSKLINKINKSLFKNAKVIILVGK